MAYSTVSVTPGVGAGIAVDVISGADYQRVKLAVGAEGVGVDVSAGAPLPVNLYVGASLNSNSAPIPVIPGLQLTSDFSELALNIAANGDNDLVAAVSGQKHRVWAWWFKVNGAAGVSLKFKDGAGTDFHPALPFNDKDGWVMGPMARPWFTGTANTKLIMNLSAAIQVSGRLYYTTAA